MNDHGSGVDWMAAGPRWVPFIWTAERTLPGTATREEVMRALVSGWDEVRAKIAASKTASPGEWRMRQSPEGRVVENLDTGKWAITVSARAALLPATTEFARAA